MVIYIEGRAPAAAAASTGARSRDCVGQKGAAQLALIIIKADEKWPVRATIKTLKDRLMMLVKTPDGFSIDIFSPKCRHLFRLLLFLPFFPVSSPPLFCFFFLLLLLFNSFFCVVVVVSFRS